MFNQKTLTMVEKIIGVYNPSGEGRSIEAKLRGREVALNTKHITFPGGNLACPQVECTVIDHPQGDLRPRWFSPSDITLNTTNQEILQHEIAKARRKVKQTANRPTNKSSRQTKPCHRCR
jgi:hypothetical protein